MGWPLAVSAGLMERSPRALVAALWPLAVGHLLAMLLVILPFALLVTLVEWQRHIQIGASLLVIGFGIFRLVNRRHPRALARIPTDATGALVLCGRHRAWRGTDAGADLSRALPGGRPRQGPRGGREPHQRQSWHGGAGRHRPRHRDDRCRRMLGVAGLSLSRSQFVSRSWFNLDTSWAVSLILVGAIALVLSLAE